MVVIAHERKEVSLLRSSRVVSAVRAVKSPWRRRAQETPGVSEEGSINYQIGNDRSCQSIFLRATIHEN